LRQSPTGRDVAAAPPTPRRPVVDTFHGVDVEDPYRWLEDGSDPEVGAWIAAQNGHARKFLDAWPGRDALRSRISELTISGSVVHGALHAAGGRLFAIKKQPPLE
jgi:prolyl oligopeptidase